MSDTGKERREVWICDSCGEALRPHGHHVHGGKFSPHRQIFVVTEEVHEAALAKARKEGREEVREALESDETRDRLRELLKEDGWTYLTPNSVENLFNLLSKGSDAKG